MILDEMINKYYGNLNENDLHIWKYIQSNRKECEKLSIDKLALKCNVSRTTILRFAKKISLNGYSELKAYIKMSNEDLIGDAQNIDLVCEAYKQAINNIKNKNCNELFSFIDKARNIFVVGFGMVHSSIKKELKRIFLSGGKIFYDVGGYNEAKIAINLANSNDLFILVSVSGENKLIFECAKALKVKNIKIVSITKLKENSLAQISDYSLYISTVCFSKLLNDVNYNSVTSYFILIDILFLKYVEYRKLSKRCENIEH